MVVEVEKAGLDRGKSGTEVDGAPGMSGMTEITGKKGRDPEIVKEMEGIAMKSKDVGKNPLIVQVQKREVSVVEKIGGVQEREEVLKTTMVATVMNCRMVSITGLNMNVKVIIVMLKKIVMKDGGQKRPLEGGKDVQRKMVEGSVMRGMLDEGVLQETMKEVGSKKKKINAVGVKRVEQIEEDLAMKMAQALKIVKTRGEEEKREEQGKNEGKIGKQNKWGESRLKVIKSQGKLPKRAVKMIQERIGKEDQERNTKGSLRGQMIGQGK